MPAPSLTTIYPVRVLAFSHDWKGITRMGKIMSAAAILAVIVGLVTAPSAANSAVTRAAESVYTTSSMQRCFTDGDILLPATGCVYFKAYTTYSSTQVWINGKVSCSRSGDSPPVDITWCGVGGGNGTGYLNIGVNWNVPGWQANNLYERMNIVEGGEGCTTFGTDSRVGQIYSWSNGSLTCEAPA